ncbi:MAG: hypothetical protein WCK34_14220 [Bacteroidota bacterium]
MKKIMILVICLGISFQIHAQDAKHKSQPNDTSEFHTIFHKLSGICKIPRGYFIELNGGYSHLGHRNVFIPGISMGVILNHHWTAGMSGSFINTPGSDDHASQNDTTGSRRYRGSSHGGYGGLLLEYTLFPKSKVHLSFPLILGGGYIFHSTRGVPGDSIGDNHEWSHHNFHGEHFMVIEPGVKLELNLLKKVRLGLGVSYRYSPERDRMITSPNLLNQLTAKLSLRLGKF